ncbi:MAG: hypothetical protein IPJ88_06350 [Myxococcales bacterium]|nr:MAG: hypothetical protein IPJ88_06350 [Myxococcales bacterium]
MRPTQKRLLRNQDGLSTVEYIIILVLIAVSGISLWRLFGQEVSKKVGTSSAKIQTMEGKEKKRNQTLTIGYRHCVRICYCYRSSL